VVKSDAGQGFGTVRLTTVPEIQTVKLKTLSALTVNEDASFTLGDRVELTGNSTTGVAQSLLVKLTSMGKLADGSSIANKSPSAFKVTYWEETKQSDGSYVKISKQTILKLGSSFQVKPLHDQTLQEALAATTVSMPPNYHGKFSFEYSLLSSSGSYSSTSVSGVDSQTVIPVAAGDTPSVKIQIGGSTPADITSDLVVPLVTNPNSKQLTSLVLQGGDPGHEQRFV
jgi:hypothetical protein